MIPFFRRLLLSRRRPGATATGTPDEREQPTEKGRNETNYVYLQSIEACMYRLPEIFSSDWTTLMDLPVLWHIWCSGPLRCLCACL